MEMVGVGSLIRMMPDGYEKACYETRAIIRNRGIKDPNDLMMLALFHLLTGCSLIEISEISKLAKFGDISDVAFMKRFGNCNEWFKWILSALRNNCQYYPISYDIPEKLKAYRILAVDASDVTEKGRSGRIFRLHFGLDIVHMHAAFYTITSNSVGEHLRNFDLSKGDLVLADRIYSSVSGIEYCINRECDYIARMRLNSFKPYDANGNPVDLLSTMCNQETGDLHVFAKKERGENAGKLFPVRICFKKKSDEAIATTKEKLRRKQSKKQYVMKNETLLFNEYMVVCTSLNDNFSLSEILDLYRYRWQVEIYFKRLKSILNYGEMPKKSEKSIFSWLNGKLMVALLIEAIISKNTFSPCERLDDEEFMERDEDCISAFDG